MSIVFCRSLETEHKNVAHKRGLFDASVGTLNLRQYYKYDEMLAHLKRLAHNHGSVLRLFSAGKSYEGRDIPVAVISSDGNLNKTTILLDAGMHAREWIAHAT